MPEPLSDQVARWLDERKDEVKNKGTGEIADRLDRAFIEAKRATLRRYVQRWRNGVIGDTHSDAEESTSGDESASEDVEEPPEKAVGIEPLDRPYRYDDDGDYYELYLESAGGRVQIDGDTAREMKRLYSREVGEAETINEICRKFGWRRRTFEEFKRSLEWVHAEDRYTDEEHQRRETSDLVEETAQARRAEYVQARNREIWNDIKSDADKWRRWSAEVAEPLVEGVRGASVPSVTAPDTPTDDLAAVLFPSDGHLDQEGYDGDGLEANIDRWLRCHHRICQRVQRLGAPERVYLALGSDQWNVDTDKATTTSGTPQQNARRPAAAISQVAEAGCEAIEIAREVGPVRVRVVPGNHDRRTCQLYQWALEARYESVDDVEVAGPPEVRQYEMYGRNLLLWCHGNHLGGGSTKKAQTLASVVASERAEMWGESTHRFAHIGHLHHSWEHDDAIRVQQVPTVTPADEWHHREGYITAQRAQVAWLYAREGGQVARVEAAVREG